ncbi:MAG: ankyrin repeat domain-containing protein, partial [Pseudomonadota bacterium]|nr:ankyrin repeat domain-containing protein [Pseudomonadota bacterium]
ATDLRLGARPLHNSARQGHVAVSELLIRHGADLDARTLHGDVALHLAATEGHSALVALLLKYRARFDIKDSEGRTPVQRAEENGHEDVVEIMRKYLTDEWPYLRLVNG